MTARMTHVEACRAIDPHLPAAVRASIPQGWTRRLTNREVAIVRLVAEGLGNKEVGEQLYLSGYTIKTHIHRIARATGATGRAGIVAACFRAGVIS